MSESNLMRKAFRVVRSCRDKSQIVVAERYVARVESVLGFPLDGLHLDLEIKWAQVASSKNLKPMSGDSKSFRLVVS